MIRKLALLIVVSLVVGVGGGWFWLSSGSATGESVEFVVPVGASTSTIADLLVAQGIVDSPLAFRVAVKLKGLDGRIEAGSHDLSKDMSAFDAADALAGVAFGESVRVTIPEGFTVDQVAAKLGEKTHLNPGELLSLATAATVRPQGMPDDVLTLEGFLFPETYEISESDSAQRAILRMTDAFEDAFSRIDMTRAQAANLTPYDIVIIASLVEREAKVNEDRDKVAAVIWNRLRKKMRLQIDITALYGTQHKVPTRKDLRRESPYNTYLNDGLPPTPIANPGFEALRAAANPANIEAIFYVVIDESGRHGFANDINEFNRLRQMCPKANCG